MLYPLIFQPIFKERIWGGRNLERLYQKSLPANTPIGESWEISDRPGDESVVANGRLAGRTLHAVMRGQPESLLGKGARAPERFPLLIKMIDAEAKLSLQVHPPAAAAAALGGEPKTEMWYVAHAGPEAELFVGLKKGITRAEFERQLAAQTVADCFHRVAVRRGDAMFLPSGRVHAIGAQTVIFEVQQNSDTTYRVFDWNRVDAQGQPRELHVPQSLASIDFNDFEPALLPAEFRASPPGRVRPLARNELFEVSLRELPADKSLSLPQGRMQILGALEGMIEVSAPVGTVELGPGRFCLVPAQCGQAEARAHGAASFLQIYGAP